MKCFLINLDRSPDRLAFFRRQADQASVAFERVRAIEGAALSLKERQSILSVRHVFQPLNDGEIGVFLSHRACWQALVTGPEAQAAIFEDDVLLAVEAGEILSRLKHLPFKADILKLETTRRKVVVEEAAVEVSPGFRLHQLKTWHGGAAAYVITRAGAEKLLQQTMPLADPVDQVMFNPLSPVSNQLAIAQLIPAIAVQEGILNPSGSGTFVSTIGRSTRRRGLFRHGLVTDIRRLWLKQKERRRRQRLARTPGMVSVVVPFAGRKENS